MATYDLNEELKRREAALAAKKAEEGQESGEKEVALDDVRRVKVLSPGRQVFKRFIRNRLAVFGSILLISMFVFSFLGPLFYPYGQKQIFYTYDKQNVNYALAKQNTAFNGYDIADEVTAERPVVNSMNSNIKKMIAEGLDTLLVLGENGGYRIRRYGEDVYILSSGEAVPVCSTGSGTVVVGTYSQITKSIEYQAAAVEGLDEAAQENISGKSGSFTYNGVEYSFTRGAAKSYEITSELSGVSYTGKVMDKGFEQVLEDAVGNSASFEYDGADYLINRQGQRYDVYEIIADKDEKIYTCYTLDTRESGQKVSNEFRVAALLASGEDGKFSYEGKNYTIVGEEGVLEIYDADGAAYAEFTPFAVRRYTGEDTMEYNLKKAISAKIEEMQENGVKSGILVHELPQQNEDGSYTRNEDGSLVYNETEMKITQRDTGEYVINCDQINYIIDMFSSPSSKHILGTDGDGFDVMARIMYGGRISLMVGFVVVFLELFIGVIMGGLAGFYGGWVDMLIMRLVDIFYCLPSMPIMIILGAMMDAMRMDTYIRLMIMMAALGIMGWAGVARLVRGQILSLREQEFMVAAEATGIRVKDRIFRHLVPNVMPQLIVTATMGMGGVILTESTLSFLGLGVKHPLATWGTIINSVSSASAMAHYAHIWIPVGLLICVTVIAFNFVGDGLRDAYDPKSKG